MILNYTYLREVQDEWFFLYCFLKVISLFMRVHLFMHVGPCILEFLNVFFSIGFCVDAVFCCITLVALYSESYLCLWGINSLVSVVAYGGTAWLVVVGVGVTLCWVSSEAKEIAETARSHAPAATTLFTENAGSIYHSNEHKKDSATVSPSSAVGPCCDSFVHCRSTPASTIWLSTASS